MAKALRADAALGVVGRAEVMDAPAPAFMEALRALLRRARHSARLPMKCRAALRRTGKLFAMSITA